MTQSFVNKTSVARLRAPRASPRLSVNFMRDEFFHGGLLWSTWQGLLSLKVVVRENGFLKATVGLPIGRQ